MTEKQMEQLREDDVVALLLRQHGLVREMFDEVDKSKGARRAEAFQRLARMLAVHEAAEEEVVHPYVEENIKGAKKVVQARLREEKEAKKLLTQMMERGADDKSFDSDIEKLKTDVLEHAMNEEHEEFPIILENTGEDQRRAMGTAIKAAVHAIATDKDLTSPQAIMDRTRDVINDKMGKGR
ncbi:hemerythrin domain-containing protein [Sphaerisporangium fuscum]|uniref:hemerythrin domain-containing protein n=1 Tax=Sphaerisporangium fuscum TaxID=2835868 RepID=UPI001BDCBA62|nr:hemerythrin domain-containing protein [Sphaerisporangium fuscum]